jgi:hypothetical protein
MKPKTENQKAKIKEGGISEAVALEQPPLTTKN